MQPSPLSGSVTPKRDPIPMARHSPSPSSQPLSSTYLLSVPLDLPVLELSYKWILQHTTFSLASLTYHNDVKVYPCCSGTRTLSLLWLNALLLCRMDRLVCFTIHITKGYCSVRIEKVEIIKQHLYICVLIWPLADWLQFIEVCFEHVDGYLGGSLSYPRVLLETVQCAWHVPLLGDFS